MKRFVRCALDSDYPLERLDAEEEQWCQEARRKLRTVEHLCRSTLLPADEMWRWTPADGDFVRRVLCDDDLQHCVAWLADDRGTDLPLHLRLDDSGLTRVTSGSPRSHTSETYPLPDEPPHREVECSPLFRALAEDAVGDEFWLISGTSELTYTAQRLCGDAAITAVRELGDRWRCRGNYCTPLIGCGNHCRTVSGGHRGDRVVVAAAFDGMEGGGGIPIEPAKLVRLRRQVACGATESVVRRDFAAARP